LVIERQPHRTPAENAVGTELDQLARSGSTVLTKLEATYYRAVAALYAGDIASARGAFSEACASEESDEANDIKYKSYVMLGHLSHEAHDYAGAKELHDKSMQYSHNDNVTAQALALKALNAYALRDYDEALKLFRESLELFNANEPFFNSYFHRNALLFCGAKDHGMPTAQAKDLDAAWRDASRAIDEQWLPGLQDFKERSAGDDPRRPHKRIVP